MERIDLVDWKDKQFYERWCDTLDRRVDDLVYKLYDITPEERRIIETGQNRER